MGERKRGREKVKGGGGYMWSLEVTVILASTVNKGLSIGSDDLWGHLTNTSGRKGDTRHSGQRWFSSLLTIVVNEIPISKRCGPETTQVTVAV